jgi:hypothetical protein
MQKLHKALESRFPWYERWHKDPYANLLTWVLFLAFATTYMVLMLVCVQKASIEVESETLVSAASGSIVRSMKTVGTPAEARLKDLTDTVIRKNEDYRLRQSGTALEALRAMLVERRNTYAELALTNPQEVRRYVFDERARQSIPQAARDLVEQPFEKEGIFHILLVSEFINEDEKSHEEYYLEIGETERYRLAITEEEAYELKPETKTKVVGMELSETIVVPTRPLEQELGEEAVLGATTLKNLAVIAFNFRDDTTQSMSVEELRGRYFTNTNSVAAHMRDVSSGQWDIQGDVFGWYTIDMDAATGCTNLTAFTSAAETAFVESGRSLSDYTNIQYIFPDGITKCGWSGLAYMPGSKSWVVGGSGAGVAVHELGHNYGFHHAATPSLEYGDGSDPMGGTQMVHYGNYNKGKFWIPSSQIMTITSPGTYTLAEVKNASSTDARVIRIPKNDGTEKHLVLEYRGDGGFDDALSSSYKSKVLVRTAPSTFITAKTYLIASISAGSSYTSTVDGITVNVVSTSPNSATLAIQLSTSTLPCLRQNPSVAIAPLGQWGNAGESLTYTLTVKNNDTQSCGQSTFSVNSTLPANFVQTPSSLTLNLAPGQENSLPITITSPTNAVASTYAFTEVVTNTLVPTSTTNAAGNYNITYIPPGDSIPPTVTITSPANGATIKGAKVSVSASASDASGISVVELRIDGVLVKTCTTVTQCTHSWDTKKLTRGSHVVTATAYDASSARNRGETSIIVTK